MTEGSERQQNDNLVQKHTVVQPGRVALALASAMRWLLVAAMLGVAATTWWQASAPATTKSAETYTCPMHPTYTMPGQGSCPICGMDLVPQASLADDSSPTVDEHASFRLQDVSGVAPVRIDTGRLLRAGVRSAEVQERDLHVQHRMAATVVRDDTQNWAVTARTGGWVQQLVALLPGEMLRKGTTVAVLYSRELQEAQAEFLATAQTTLDQATGGQQLRSAAAERLRRLGMGGGAVSGLGHARGVVSLVAPRDGLVLERPVLKGSYLAAGQPVLVLGEPNALLTLAELPHDRAHEIKLGDTIDIALADGATCTALVLSDDPLAVVGAFARVRARLLCPSGSVRVGATVHWLFSQRADGVVAVADEAVIDAGTATYVYRTDNAGRMLPTRIRTGLRADGWVQVSAGLAKGDWVVTSAAFVVDAEARIAAAAPVQPVAPPSDARKSTPDPHAAHKGGVSHD